MTDPDSAQGDRKAEWVPPVLLLITGGLLAVTVIVSQRAATEGAAMLWFLATVMGGAGLILLAATAVTGKAKGNWRHLLIYSLGGGVFRAVPNAMVYLSIVHVGAGFVSVAFAFPLLLTYLMALVFRMERFAPLRALGVAVALSGGLFLVFSKVDAISAESGAAGWVIIASLSPIIVAGGNLYRTRFWPPGAPPMLLAALMLIFAALLVAVFAVLVDGGSGIPGLWLNQQVLILTGINIVVFALQYIAFFQLQHVAGPVYLSQIGSVAAAVGIPVAVLFLGEVLPQGFAFALLLIVTGAVLFQVTSRRAVR
jgi:drug/metabolite transporter (DMT)-like permease